MASDSEEEATSNVWDFWISKFLASLLFPTFEPKARRSQQKVGKKGRKWARQPLGFPNAWSDEPTSDSRLILEKVTTAGEGEYIFRAGRLD